MQSHTGRLTTHVLDTALGKPAEGLRIDLFRVEGDRAAERIGSTRTNDDGRCDPPLLSGERMKTGTSSCVSMPATISAARPARSPSSTLSRSASASLTRQRTITYRCFFRRTAMRPIAGAE
jgi:hypothetical protein